MTPKPANLPPVDQMTAAQSISEAARVLRNSEHDYFTQLADRLERMIDQTNRNA